MEGNKPSAHIEGQFEVVGVVPGNVILKDNTTVDLRTITLEKANELHAMGFPYLKKIVSKKVEEITPEDKSNTIVTEEENSTKKEATNNSNKNRSGK